MLADEDHPLEDDATTSTLTARPEPQVMVVYRRQGVPWVLVPPLLLIAAVVGIIGYRKSAPTARPIIIAQAPPAVPVEPPTPIVAPVPAPTITATPVVPVVAATPTPPTVVPAEPPPAPAAPPQPAPIVEPAPAIVPEESVKRDAVGFDPDAAKVAAAPIPADGPPLRDGRPSDGPAPNTTEAVRSVFQDEAEARHAERLRLEAAKPGLLEGDPRDSRARRQAIIVEARRDADRDRLRFHADLRRLVSEKGYQAGRDIRELFDTYGGPEATIPEIQIAMTRDLVGPSARLSTPARIARMRQWGQPEHLILEDIQLGEARNRNGRNGPQTYDQSWVFAARILLSYPPTKPATAARPVGTAPAPR